MTSSRVVRIRAAIGWVILVAMLIAWLILIGTQLGANSQEDRDSDRCTAKGLIPVMTGTSEIVCIDPSSVTKP